MSDQMVFKRCEIKYLISKEQKQQILNAMAPYMKEDEHGRSTILSLYMDTPDYLLARRSLDKPFYKEKIRLRSYGVAQGDTTVFLELKKKYDGIVYKRRESMKEKDLENYLNQGILPKDSQIMREIHYSVERYKGLRPAVLLSYEREAFYAKDDHEFRITFDENILWRKENVNLTSPVGGEPILNPDQCMMEVKTAGAIPLWLVETLSKNKIYRTSFSKYGKAYQTIMEAQRVGQREEKTVKQYESKKEQLLGKARAVSETA